jgi:hypothetical protein
VTYDATSPGIRRTTIYTYPVDRERLRELVRQMTIADPAAPVCTMSDAIRLAVEWTLRYGYGIGAGEDTGQAG